MPEARGRRRRARRAARRRACRRPRSAARPTTPARRRHRHASARSRCRRRPWRRPAAPRDRRARARGSRPGSGASPIHETRRRPVGARQLPAARRGVGRRTRATAARARPTAATADTWRQPKRERRMSSSSALDAEPGREREAQCGRHQHARRARERARWPRCASGNHASANDANVSTQARVAHTRRGPLAIDERHRARRR